MTIAYILGNVANIFLQMRREHQAAQTGACTSCKRPFETTPGFVDTPDIG